MNTKVLMVCLGNICRSPLAEGILKSKVYSQRVFVDSAGTAGYHIGRTPDKRSITVAKKYGIDISQQICRKLTAADLDEFDMIYAMDQSNYNHIIGLTRSAEHRIKVRLLLDEVGSNEKEVPDPYYDGNDGFENVYKLIDRACTGIAKKLRENNG